MVVSQSCDLLQDKVDEVLLAAVFQRSELPPELATRHVLEEIRTGRRPALHMLASHRDPRSPLETRVVDFRRVYALPLGFVRQFASDHSPRLRLLPPYREYLAQAFARFFMRVGLPVDIPKFT